MARIRTIKPEFWRNEHLSELPEATHMLAAALLNYADDEGYFNANPALIQSEVSPLRAPSVSVLESLERLQAIEYIALGSDSRGRRFGRIVAFEEHQRVSHPTPSRIKAMKIVWDGSGENPESSPTCSETLRPEGKGKEEQGRERSREGEEPRSAGADEIILAVEAYNLVAKDLDWPVAQNLTHARRRNLTQRLKECGGIEGFRAAMEKARASRFLRGETGRDKTHANWTPGFDFFLQQSAFTKLMEGKYDDRDRRAEPDGFAAVVAGARAAAG